MKIQVMKLSTPVKVVVSEEAEVMDELKKKAYSKMKPHLETTGYRKGKVPIDVAESKIGVEKLYQDLVDRMCYQVMDSEGIVSTSDFKFYSDLRGSKPFKMEFIGERRPDVTLPDWRKFDIDIQDSKVEESDVDAAVENALKEKSVVVDHERKVLEDMDLIVIDYEGVMDGEDEPFKGGSAKDFQMTLNVSKRSFIDNFEDQMIGMEVGEVKSIGVTFPDNYKDDSKSNKRAVFTVTLKGIKKKVPAELNDDFLKEKGFTKLEDYRDFLRQRIEANNKRSNAHTLQKDLVNKLVDESEITPIPVKMIEGEIRTEWVSFLDRMGQSEEDALKKNDRAKEEFWAQSEEGSKRMIKTKLVLDAVAQENEISVSKEEVHEYTNKVSKAMMYDDDRIKRIMNSLKDRVSYNSMETSARNERTIEFLTAYFKNAAD